MSTESYFAVQMQRVETPDAVAKAILTHCRDTKRIFSSLEQLDTFTVGANSFVRFRANVPDPDGLLEGMLAQGRGIIGLAAKGYRVRFPDGRNGSFSNMTMQAVPRALKAFRGTTEKHWERQFMGLATG